MAIIAVLLCHANTFVGNLFPSPGHPIANAFTKIAGAGWVGVDLFFVLSGFLITRILYRTKGQAHYFRNFYMRRALRIFPLYYFYAALVMFGSYAWKHAPAWDVASVLLYFYNFRVAQLGHHLPLVNQLWSLAVEEHFYLLWPLIIRFSNAKVIIRVTLAGCALSFFFRLAVLHGNPFIVAPYVLSPCRLDGLFLGSFLAIANMDTSAWRQVKQMAPLAFAISFLSLLAIAGYQGHFYDFVAPGQYPGVNSSQPVLLIGLTLLAIFFSSILVFVLDGPAQLTSFLEHPILRNVGIYSYGIYIYHIVVITAVLVIMRSRSHSISVPNIGLKLLLFIFDLLVSTLVASLSFKYLERPILRFKSSFPQSKRETKLTEQCP